MVRNKGTMPLAALSRHLGLHRTYLQHFAAGNPKHTLAERHQRLLQKFIMDWDAGLIDVTKVSLKSAFVWRETPRRMPMVCKVEPLGASLALKPRLPAPHKPPSVSAVFGRLLDITRR